MFTVYGMNGCHVCMTARSDNAQHTYRLVPF